MSRAVGCAICFAVGMFLSCGCGRRPLGLSVHGDPDAIGAKLILNGELVATLAPSVQSDDFRSPPDLFDCYGDSGIVAAAGVPHVMQSVKVIPGYKNVLVVGAKGDTLRGSVEMNDSPVMFIYMKCKHLSLW